MPERFDFSYRPRKKVTRGIYGHDPGCPFRSKHRRYAFTSSVPRIKSPFALRTTVGNVTRSRYTIPSSQNIYFDPFPRRRSLSFLPLSLFHYIPLVSSTCSSFRKTQPPRKTILSHNLRLLQWSPFFFISSDFLACFRDKKLKFHSKFPIYFSANLRTTLSGYCSFGVKRAE